MAEGIGIGFDLSKALLNAEKLDEKLSDMVASASKLEQTMTNAFKAGGATEILNRLQQRLTDIGDKKVDVHFETKKAEELYSVMDNIVSTMSIMSRGGKVELFDTKKVYDTADSMLLVEHRLAATQAKIEALRKEWNEILIQEFDESKFSAPINKRTGKAYGKDTKTYANVLNSAKQQFAEQQELERMQIESQMRVLIETEAIQKKELQWASMTEDQKAQYVQKRLNEVLKAEQKHTSEVQKEYSKLSSEIVRIYDQIQRTEKSVAKGEKTGVGVSKEKGQLTTLESQLREKLARQQQIEQESGNLILRQIEDFWVKVQERDRKGLEDRIKAQQDAKKREEEEWQKYIRTPEGAIGMSESAKSINDEREAIKLLISARDNLSQSTANYQQIIDDLNNRIQKHRISIEQLTTAEKNEQTLQPTIRNEYTRLLRELDQIADAKKRLSATESYKGRDSEARRAMNDILAREQDVQNKIAEIRRNAQGLLDETERKHAADRANNEIAEIERVERKRQEFAKLHSGLSPMQAQSIVMSGQGTQAIADEEKEIQRLIEQKYALDKQDKDYIQTINRLDDGIAEHRHNLKILTEEEKKRAEQNKYKKVGANNDGSALSSQQAADVIAHHDSAKSINQHLAAIKALQNAKRNLDTTDANYERRKKQLTEAENKHRQALETLGHKLDEVKNKQKGLLNISEQLTRRLALLFSVSQIPGYIRKLAQVRGEFELQQRALIGIVKNSNEAKKIWTQTVELAVKSPFRVKELVTYTKQLAAYRIETEKLFETNKKLADVSAGLGVDMSRLILAYGQVKAANFLRGTELRQFTEAGVNMLDELAKYYSEVEGKSVKVAEVFDRISKRMVTFEAVDEVFNRITGTGGTFYKMQEQQAETLKGQISNLYDSIDIMLNDIGKQNESVLKGTVGLARDVVQNWQAIANVAIPVIEAITVKWVAFNLFAKYDSVFKKMKASILGVTNGLKGWAAAGALLKSAFSWTNVITVAIVALSNLLMTHLQHRHELEQINKRYEEMHRRLAAISTEFSKASRNSDTKKMLKEYGELADMAEREYSIKAKIKIDEESSKEEIAKAFNEIQREVDSQNAFNAAFSEAVLDTTKWTVQDDVNEDLAEMGKNYATLRMHIENYRHSLIAALEKESQTVATNKTRLKALKELQKEYNKETETEEQYVLRISNALKSISGGKWGGQVFSFGPNSGLDVREMELVNKSLTEIADSFRKLKASEEEAEKEFNEVLEKLDGELLGLTKKEMEIKLKAAIDTHAANEELNAFVVQKEYEFANKRFEINIVPEIKIPKQEELQEWQKRFNAWFGGEAYGGMRSKFSDFRKADAESTREGMLKYYDELYKQIEKEVNNIRKGTAAYVNEDLGKAEQRLKEVNEMRKFFGPDSTKTTRTGENKALELTKKRIDFVKRLNEEYEKQRELFDEITAKQNVLDSMGAEGTGLGFDISKMKFTSKEETLDELKNLESEAKKVGATFEYLKAHSDIALDIKVKKKEEADQALLKEVEKLFSNYEVSLELNELELPKDLQKNIFKVDNISLPELRAQVEAKKDEFTGTDQEKKYQEYLDKISELENKELTERGKKYSKYLVKAQGERVKLKMEELRAISELDEMADKRVITGTQNELAQSNIRKETQAKIDKMIWEEFKDSGMYVRLFEDMEYASTAALESMQQRLSELKTQLKDLDADDLRNLYNQLEKIEDELATRNPFKTSVLGINDYIKALKERKDLEKKAIEEDKNLAEAQKNYNKASDKLVIEKAEYEALDKRLRADGKITEEEQKQLDAARKNIQLSEGALRAAQSILETQKETTKEANKQNDENKKKIKLFKESVGKVGQYVSQASSALPQVASDMEQVFGTMDASTKDTIDTISEISGGLGEMMTSFASGDIIGTITGLTKTISAIFSIGDKANERQIQKDLKRVEQLQKAYEKIEKAIDNAYNINTLEVNTKKAKENLEAQIAATERMIKAEEDKKKKDKDRIAQWRDEIDAYKEQLKELEEQRLESLGGIGSDANKKSMTEDFVDAWLEAFKETGDGLQGLEDKFDEFLENYIKRQMVLKVASKYLDPLMADIDAYLGNDNVLDNNELELIGERSAQAFEIINKALEGLVETTPAIEDAVGKSSLSGLSKGIQGITEEQADVLASYWNAVRGYTASIDFKMDTVISLLSPNAAHSAYADAQRAASNTSLESQSNQPILAELQTQTQIMREISSMFDSVIGRGSGTHSGAYLKVLI